MTQDEIESERRNLQSRGSRSGQRFFSTRNSFWTETLYILASFRICARPARFPVRSQYIRVVRGIPLRLATSSCDNSFSRRRKCNHAP